MLTSMISFLSEVSLVLPSEAGDGRSSIYPAVVGNSFAFKLEDQKGRIHRFACGGYSFHTWMIANMVAVYQLTTFCGSLLQVQRV
jgi:hypothetical protein